jgi:hypothetical protein
MTALEPRNVHPIKWRQAVDVAREACARFFCEGRSPADAVRAYGLAPAGFLNWVGAVNAIAELHHATPKRAA